MQTILGAGGNIGKPLAKELIPYDPHIRLMSRNPQKINETDELFPGDLTDKERVEKAVEGSHIAYLVAGLAYKLKEWKEKWPVIMQNTIDACKKHNTKLVFFDNAYMYDPGYLENLTEETPVNPSSKKGKVRAAIAENLMQEMKAGNLHAMIVRASDFYGPGVSSSVIMETVYKKLKDGKTPIWLGNPSAWHSLTFTPDAAKATALLGNTADAYDQVWHLPTESEKLTGKQWVELFAKELKRPAKFKAVPGKMVRFMGNFVPLFRELGDVMVHYDSNYYFNCEKFKKRFPDFRITGPEEGVRETVKGG